MAQEVDQRTRGLTVDGWTGCACLGASIVAFVIAAISSNPDALWQWCVAGVLSACLGIAVLVADHRGSAHSR